MALTGRIFDHHYVTRFKNAFFAIANLYFGFANENHNELPLRRCMPFAQCRLISHCLGLSERHAMGVNDARICGIISKFDSGFRNRFEMCFPSIVGKNPRYFHAVAFLPI